MSVFLAASLKSLNKQEYQQSASPRCLCERRHTGLFVLGPDRKLLFRDTVARSFFFVFFSLLVRHGENAMKDFTRSFAGVCDVHLATVCVKEKGRARTTLLHNVAALPNYPSAAAAALHLAAYWCSGAQSPEVASPRRREAMHVF